VHQHAQEPLHLESNEMRSHQRQNRKETGKGVQKKSSTSSENDDRFPKKALFLKDIFYGGERIVDSIESNNTEGLLTSQTPISSLDNPGEEPENKRF